MCDPLPRVVGLALASGLLAGCGGGGGAEPVVEAQQVAVTLTRMQPASGPVGGGMEAMLVGSDFDVAEPPLYVHVGPRVVVPTVFTSSTMRIVVPGADLAGNVQVRLVTGAGVVTLPGGFTYDPPPIPPPVLTFEPGVGSYVVGVGGTRIDLTVGSFAPLVAPQVTFAGVPVASLVVLSTTRVRVEVPAGLPTGQTVPIVLAQGLGQAIATGFVSQGTLPPGTFTINEFLASPGTLDANRDGTLSTSGDELVELVNRTAAPVDLTGWTLSDSAAVRHTFPNPTTVPAGGSIVIFGSGNPTYFAPRHASGQAQVAGTGDLGLNNTSDTITLRDPAATVIAQTSYVSADVTAGKSRNASTDGGSLPLPAASVDYSLHDAVPGAVGAASPGTRVSGMSFP
jgi:hypothetical protein